MAVCFSHISYLSFGTEIFIAKRSDGHCDRAFLTENKACWTIDPGYRLHRFCHVRT